MLITWKEDGVEHSITIAPENESITVTPTIDSLTGKRDYALVWIMNDISGSSYVVSGVDRLNVTGWMQNGATIKKSTHRVS